MLFEIIAIILTLLLPFFFLFGFMCGVRKGQNPNAPIFRQKNEQSEEQRRMETLSRNIANYVGNSEGQEKI